MLAAESSLQCSSINPPEQIELNFAANGRSDGIHMWREQRFAALQKLAQEKGLPVGKQVEVWLISGIRLRGQLRLSDEMLFIEESRNSDVKLRVDNVTFQESEMESCLRLD